MATLFAVFLSVIMFAIGVSIDFSRMTNEESRMQAIADAAALAGASLPKDQEADRLQIVRSFIRENATHLSVRDADLLSQTAAIGFDDEASIVTIELTRPVQMSFSSLLSDSHRDVAATSQVLYRLESVQHTSIALVLDFSSSMNDETPDGIPKSTALKSATGELFTTLDANVADRESFVRNLRSSMVAYDRDIIGHVPIDRGYGPVLDAVNNLETGQGTNSFIGMEAAALELSNDRAIRTSDAPLNEIVVLMTDGSNSVDDEVDYDIDSETRRMCTELKSQGVTIYSIAFAAPDDGKRLLLECASDSVDMNAMADVAEDEACLDPEESCGISVMEADKEGHFFDASDAEDIENAFADIGMSISEINMRLVNRP